MTPAIHAKLVALKDFVYELFVQQSLNELASKVIEPCLLLGTIGDQVICVGHPVFNKQLGRHARLDKLVRIKVVKFTGKGKGKLSYTKAKGKKGISVNKKTGAVTVKKGLSAGAYKVKVKIKAAGDRHYKAAAKSATFKITVT